MGLLPDGTPMEVDPALRLRHRQATTPEVVVPEYVKLPIDNFAKNAREHGYFYNRYWVAQSAYKPGAPVFIYDVGEANAEGNALFRILNETSFFKQLVDKYNGIGIVWEHRFYGNSTPEPIDINTPPEAFKFLNTEQSLADVDKFAWQFSRPNIKYDLTPKKTPWIFVGGSYPAMRAAFMREKYPQTIYAGFASSAPTEARVDMSVYFEPVWRGMNAYGFGNCTQDIKASVQWMDKLMENPAKAKKLKEQFFGAGAGKNSNPTFGDALTTIFYLWQSYGVDGGAYSLRNFCDWLETDPKANKTAPEEGWAKSKGAQYVVDRWAAYPRFAPMVGYYLTTECPGECDLDLKFKDPASIAWTWQYCTQWGYLQSANLGPRQLVSRWNSLDHQKDICHRQFPTAPRNLLPEWPAVSRTNAKFGGWDIRPSNLYWSGGEFDPWRTLSPLSSEPFAPKVRAFSAAPRCGEGSRKSEIFGHVLKGAQHCYDFRTTFAGGEVSRRYFTDALDGWLKCWRPRYS
ncbi:peptidase S28 [Amniculicola lignicola CBS 123094]|uniref:Peptidase S28 n=1 Tax=Amniculicola lignicola CBS 123094 TaxID=1392246 RepID=A0A6A5WKH0_9PLEO|nr:peptidase S28 [Amniculicola lignicola CBS 123094]